MKVGDLIKFIGSWGPTVTPGERLTGIVMKVWTDGRTGKVHSLDVFWDNGDHTATMTFNLRLVT